MAVSKFSSSAEQPANQGGLPSVPWDRVERFVGQLTHDIRNGLNALELQLTFLGEISTDPEAVDEIKRLRGTLVNVNRQLQTLKTAMGATTPYPLEYPAGEFFDDLRERFTKQHPGSDGKVIWEVGIAPENLLTVDPELTLSALLELLANGLSFARGETQPMRVRITAAADHAIFLLEEPQPTGPAVSPEDWGRTPLLTTRRGAYGLGLFRVRRCLEIQGGTLDVEYSARHSLLTTAVTLPGVSPQQP